MWAETAEQHESVVVGALGTTHLAIARSFIRVGSRGRFINALDFNASRPRPAPAAKDAFPTISLA